MAPFYAVLLQLLVTAVACRAHEDHHHGNKSESITGPPTAVATGEYEYTGPGSLGEPTFYTLSPEESAELSYLYGGEYSGILYNPTATSYDGFVYESPNATSTGHGGHDHDHEGDGDGKHDHDDKDKHGHGYGHGNHTALYNGTVTYASAGTGISSYPTASENTTFTSSTLVPSSTTSTPAEQITGGAGSGKKVGCGVALVIGLGVLVAI